MTFAVTRFAPVVRYDVDVSTVLLVMPHAGLRSGLRSLLEEEGFRVVESSDQEVGLLVFDLALGEATTEEVVRAARAAHRDLLVLYIVDEAPEHDPVLRAALEVPRTTYTRMPLEFEDLLRAARELLTSRRG